MEKVMLRQREAAKRGGDYKRAYLTLIHLYSFLYLCYISQYKTFSRKLLFFEGLFNGMGKCSQYKIQRKKGRFTILYTA